MSTPETLRYDAELEERDGFLQECPECGHTTLVTTESYPATRIDPACSAGYCVCREDPYCGCRHEFG